MQLEFPSHEAHLEGFKRNLEERYLEKEKALSKAENERREVFLEEKKRIKDFREEVNSEKVASEELRKILAETRKRLELVVNETEAEKERYQKDNLRQLDQRAENYVSRALEQLHKKGKEYHTRSKGWAYVGAFVILGGIV